jgi:hypothetical protein
MFLFRDVFLSLIRYKNMRRRLLSFFIYTVLVFTSVKAQQFFPYAFLKAVEKGTRTYEGVPGANYFQNHSDYLINAIFNPSNGRLDGVAEIKYYNQSPDTLRRLVLRLYQNILKKGGVRDEEIDPENINDGVHIIALKVNGNDITGKLKFYTRIKGTNMSLTLAEPLLPASSVKIEISWSVAMPLNDVHRYGKYGEGTYFVGYWYPQLSVYDDLNGWDEINYTGTQEFYNDFNNYDVRIKVPGSYLVWATGQWMNPEDILSGQTRLLLKQAGESDTKIEVITPDDLRKKSWMIKGREKTYHYKVSGISDFAFALSDRYCWDAASVVVDSVDMRRVLINAVYLPGTKNFDKVADTGAEVIRHFSYFSYGIPYPFPVVTIFRGEGGMEYPMILNNGEQQSYSGTYFITMHELAHAYFPFLTGLNERKYAWMDEGLTTYLPLETEVAVNSKDSHLREIVQNYESAAGSDLDIPLSVSSSQTRGMAYYYQSYFRSAIAFYMLENYIGRDAFRDAVREFVRIWKYKHPAPYDLFAVIKSKTDKDIDWFVSQWFFQQGWPDLAIENVSLTGNMLRAEIARKGAFAVPVRIEVTYKNSETEVFEFSPDVWKESEKFIFTQQIKIPPVNMRLNYLEIPDKNRSDNYYEFPSN